jgi:hypothetical protein
LINSHAKGTCHGEEEEKGEKGFEEEGYVILTADSFESASTGMREAPFGVFA